MAQPHLRRRLANAAWEKARSIYSRKAVAMQTRRVYEDAKSGIKRQNKTKWYKKKKDRQQVMAMINYV